MANIKLKLTGLTMGLLMAAACQSQVAVTSPGFDTDAYQRVVRRAGMTGGVLGVGDDRLAATPYPSSYAADMWLTLVARRAGMPTPGPTPTPAPTATPGPTPTPSPTPTPGPVTGSFAYVGRTADAVGNAGTSAGYNPNSVMDHQFTVTVNSPDTRYLQSLTVIPVAGPASGEWNTDDTANWHAKVYNGTVTTSGGAVTAGTLIPTPNKVVAPANLGVVDGAATYTVFLESNGSVVAGAEFVVTVVFTDGTTASWTQATPIPATVVYVNKPTTGTATWVETSAGSSTGGHYDDFNEASLDPSKWTVYDSLSTGMTGSALKMAGTGYIETTAAPLMAGYVEWRYRDLELAGGSEYWSGPMSMSMGGWQVFHQASPTQKYSQSNSGPGGTNMGPTWAWDDGAFHTARVEWGPTGTTKSIDGVVWFSDPTPYTATPLPFIFRLSGGMDTVEIDWVDYNGVGGTAAEVKASGLYAGGTLELIDGLGNVLAAGPTNASGIAYVDISALSLPTTCKFRVLDSGGAIQYTSAKVTDVYGGDAYKLNRAGVTVTISGALGPVVNARISVGGVALAGTVTAAGASVTLKPTNVGDLENAGAVIELLDSGGAVLASSPLGTVYHGDSYAFAVY